MAEDEGMTNLPAPDGMPMRIDPMSEYEQQRAALLAADTSGYVDPHFTDARRDPDALPGGDGPELSLPADAGPGAEDDGGTADGEASAGAAPSTRPPQFRIRPRNELDTAAAWHLRRNPELSFDEALGLARHELGLTGHGGHEMPQPDEDSPGVTELDEREAFAHPSHPAHHVYQGSAVHASQFVPPHPEARGEFLARMAALDRMLGDSHDPLFGNPNKPLILAQLVSRAMRGTELPAAHDQAEPVMPDNFHPPAARQEPVRMTAPLARGTASTTTSRGPLDRQIGEIRTPDDYRRLVGHLLGVRH